jgi:CTP synthase
MMEQRAHVTICNQLGLAGYSNIGMTVWKRDLADRWENCSEVVKIAVIGKYTNLSDAYLSVIKALQHACLAVRRKLELVWVEAGDIEAQVCIAKYTLCSLHTH